MTWSSDERPGDSHGPVPERPRLALLEAPTDGAADDVRLAPNARRAWVGGRELELTTQLFDLLSFFLAHRGEAVSFEVLASEVWAYPHGAGDHHFLHTAVYRLRRILNGAGIDDLVDGIRGYGYRISAGPPIKEEPAVLATRAIGVFDPRDADLPLSIVNDAAVGLTGYSMEALTRMPHIVDRLWPPEARLVINAVVDDAVRTGAADAAGLSLRRADGSTVLVDIAITRLGASAAPLCLGEATPLDR
ncbi:MAG: winged helix-turn-helix domain-containing protein [Chloroflexi bacterium]|nr:winged helix-turn-helix domain-containing protein [Chloroflexota bacterium]MDA1148264.1 winged helix-turn-helix domain-containing protein [Chloroflexota bacterium]